MRLARGQTIWRENLEIVIIFGKLILFRKMIWKISIKELLRATERSRAQSQWVRAELTPCSALVAWCASLLYTDKKTTSRTGFTIHVKGLLNLYIKISYAFRMPELQFSLKLRNAFGHVVISMRWIQFYLTVKVKFDKWITFTYY